MVLKTETFVVGNGTNCAITTKKYLKNFDKILSEIKEIDEDYYNQYLLNLEK